MKKHFKKLEHHSRVFWRKLKPLPHMSPWERNWRQAARAAIIAVLSMTALTILMFFYFLLTLPNPSRLRDMNLTESTLIYDRDGKILYAIHGDENRKSLDSLDEVSPYLVKATVAIEDDQYYDHWGVDVPATIKAVLSEFGIGGKRGGSTITQQFARRALLEDFSRTYSRKFKEIVMALMLEARFNKEEIMLMYLNAISYGGNAYGVQLAAERYFGKDAKDLSLAEAAILAGIPQRPTHYFPYGSYRYSQVDIQLDAETLGDRKITSEEDLSGDEYVRGLLGASFQTPDGGSFYIKGRADLVLDRMLELESITQAEYDEAKASFSTIAFKENSSNLKSPHFVLWLRSLLEEKYGSALVQEGGLKIYTTLKKSHQDAAEKAVTDAWERNNTSYGASNAAMISVDPKTGQILAYVGSADYNNNEIAGQVNMIASKKQIGSTMKPFIYAEAFAKGLAPGTVLYDVATNFGAGYTPNNYDGSFQGPLSIRRALGQSRNIPAIKAFFLAGGEEKLVPKLQALGMTSVKENADYGAPLALGAVEMSPYELAQAYSVLANNGSFIPLTPILKVENADGEILEEFKAEKIEKKSILTPEVSYMVNDILSDPSVGLGPNVRIDTLDNAAKTGTSSAKVNGREKPVNNWIAAYTPDIVSVVWVGNADGKILNANADGYTTAAPIWKNYMRSVLNEMKPAKWQRPKGIVDVAICKTSGLLPSEFTPEENIATDIFASFSVPTEVDSSYQKLKIETIQGKIATEYSPEKFVEERIFQNFISHAEKAFPSWQTAINNWVAKQSGNPESTIAFPPTETAEAYHNATTASNLPVITISTPANQAILDASQKIQDVAITVENEGNGIKYVEYFMNGLQTYTSEVTPFDGIIRLPAIITGDKAITIEAIVYDIYGYSSTSSIQVKVSNTSADEEVPSPDDSL